MNIQAEHRQPSTGPTSYDQVYYPGHVYGLTHPNHLATIATVYGMQPAPVEALPSTGSLAAASAAICCR